MSLRSSEEKKKVSQNVVADMLQCFAIFTVLILLLPPGVRGIVVNDKLCKYNQHCSNQKAACACVSGEEKKACWVKAPWSDWREL